MEVFRNSSKVDDLRLFLGCFLDQPISNDNGNGLFVELGNKLEVKIFELTTAKGFDNEIKDTIGIQIEIPNQREHFLPNFFHSAALINGKK